MMRFLLAQAKTAKAFTCIRENLAKFGPHTCSFWPDSIFVQEDRETGVFLFSMVIHNTAGFTKDYYKVTGNDIFLFDGLPYFEGVNQQNYTEALLAQHANLDEEDFHENTFGSWSKCSVTRKGAYALSDFTGMSPLYYLDTPGFNAISNRQLLLGVARDGFTQALDPLSASWLTGQASHMGTNMLISGIRHVPPACPVRMNFARKTMSIGTHQVLSPAKELGHDITRQEGDDLAQSLIDQMNALAGIIVSTKLDITGGRDSRAVVALALASRMKQKIELLQTTGDEGSRDIEVGAFLAKLVGQPHRANILDAQVYEFGNILNRIRAQAFRYEGMLCPTDAFAGGSKGSRTVISGAAGEIFRRHCKPHMDVHLASPLDVYNTYASYQQRTDPLGIQHPVVTLLQQDALRRAAFEFLATDADPNDISDAFYMQYRLPHWNGVMFNTVRSAIRVTPLANYRGYRLAFRKHYKLRIWDRYHFEVLYRVSPELAAAPLLDAPWSQNVIEAAAKRNISLPRNAFETTERKTLRDIIPVGWYLVNTSRNRLLEYLQATWTNDLGTILDLAKVKEWCTVKNPSTTGITGIKEICSVANLACLLADDYLHELDGDTSQPAKLRGAACELFGAQQLAYRDVSSTRLRFNIASEP